MSARELRLRVVFLWMCAVSLVACLLMAIVWKHYVYVNLSRDGLKSEREIGAMQNQVMVLETGIRALKQRSRLEKLAREHFGLVEGGVPILVQAEGQVLAVRNASGVSTPENKGDSVKTASWRERFR